MTNYVYVNWKKKDIVVSTSRPSPNPHNMEFFPTGRKAKHLYKNGYKCYGHINGYDMSLLNKMSEVDIIWNEIARKNAVKK